MKRVKVLLFGIILVFGVIALQTPVMADSTSHELGIVQEREEQVEGAGGYAYRTNGKDIWKIVEYVNDGITWNNAIYCIKGGPGFGGTITNPTDKRTYNDGPHDMKDIESMPANLKTVLPTDTVNTAIFNEGTEDEFSVEYTNYNAVLWIIDHMYLPKDANALALRESLLKAAFKEQLEADVTPRFELSQIALTDDDIEVVQQLALWHFTNPDADAENDYDVGTMLPEIRIKGRDNTNYLSLDDFSGSFERQTDARTLYNYLINNAILNAKDYGNSNEKRYLKSPIQLVNNTLTSEYVGNDILFGPFKIEKVSDLPFTLTATVSDEKDNVVTNYTLYKEFGSTKIQAGETETIESLIGENFYIAVNRDSRIKSISLKVKTDYYESIPDFWTVSGASNAEQPVVFVTKKAQSAEQTVGVKFDLALRKFITAINGISPEVSRVPQVTIGADGRVTYAHPKEDLILTVESGDIVTYTIRIYNEGKLAGFAEEIKDDIPEGLEFLDPANIPTGTLSSEERAGYRLNQDYGWSKITGEQSIVTSYLNHDTASNLIRVYDPETMTTLDYKDVKVAFKVTEPNGSKNTIINTAEINEDADENGNPIEDVDSIPGNGEDGFGKDENQKGAGEDDIDKEYIKLKTFDLALRKFITAVNDTAITNRVPQVNVSNSGKVTYTHPKTPVSVSNGDIVVYTIRVYNEGPTAGYADIITDDIPEGTSFIVDNPINIEYRWRLSADEKTVSTDYRSYARDAEENLLEAFDGETMAQKNYKDVKIALKVTEPNTSQRILVNTAEITEDKDKNGNPVEDEDSIPGNGEDGLGKDENGKGAGEEHIDKEYIKVASFDLALRKFITEVNDTAVTTRIPQVRIDAEGKITYEHTKDPVLVENGDIVTYTIRIYNEGTKDGYAEEVRDDVPEGLIFLPENETNRQYGWEVSRDGKTITTDYLSKAKAVDNEIKAFDRETMTEPLYKEVKVAFKVTEEELPENRVLVNTAEISKDGNDSNTSDIDSTPGNNKDGEDDIDKEYVRVKYFDLALRKFITAVNGNAVTDRIPEVTIDDNGRIIYKHTKEPLWVANTNIVTYTLRIYNEGKIDGYAKLVRDNIPDGLIFLPENETNKQYGWVLSKDGKEITTDYLSKDKAVDNLLRAFDKTSMTTPDYKEIKVAFKVTESKLPIDTILVNTAEIAEDTDKNGNPIDDIDSTPNNKNEEKSTEVDTKEINKNDDYYYFKEDDIDKEYVRVKYFDLALLKWVNKVILTVDGTTTERDTGHTGLENPEPVVKQEVDRKKLDSTTVKFEYTIKITNEGQIAGYAKEISDYIPEGLEFVKEDNPEWTEVDGKITTRALEGILLQPGESAEVKVILKWINNSENMGVKVNVAEISKDYNDFHAPDIDSTPNNKVDGEDDIDDAPVSLSIKTGTDTVVYFGLIGGVLALVAGGVVLIRKYVM